MTTVKSYVTGASMYLLPEKSQSRSCMPPRNAAQPELGAEQRRMLRVSPGRPTGGGTGSCEG